MEQSPTPQVAQPSTVKAPADFHALVDRTYPRLFRLAARITGSLGDAQDVLQESYLRAYRSLSSGGFTGQATPETWLYGIVTRVAINWIRDEARAKRREQSWSPPAQDAAAAAEARVALTELNDLLSALSADQRAALVLKEIEGFSAKEAGALLGISEGAVEQRLVRARETLRNRVRHG